MRGNQTIRIAALALAAAATLPALALAGESRWNPQEEARIEQLIEQATRGDAAGQAAQPRQAVPPAAAIQASRLPPTRSGIPGR